MARAAILVLGMHRSGTSSAAWLCGRLGAALPADGIDPHTDNQRGYFESAALVKADDQLLRVCRSSWFDPRPLDWSRLPPGGLASRRARIREAIEAAWGDAPLLAIKDPRQCRFVPVVAGVLADLGVQPRALLVLRPAAEIARSLGARDGSSPAFAHLLWLRHMIDAERATRAMPRAIVAYDMLLTDWRTALARIAPLADRPGWTPDAAEAATIDAFLDPALRHHHDAEPAELWQPLTAIVAAVSTALAALAERDDAATRAALDTATALLDAAPWLEAEITHDELRHRRVAPSTKANPFVPREVEVRAAGDTAPGTPLDGARDERTGVAPTPDPSGDADPIRNSGLPDAAHWLKAEITHDELRHRRVAPPQTKTPFMPSEVEVRAAGDTAPGTSLDWARDERIVEPAIADPALDPAAAPPHRHPGESRDPASSPPPAPAPDPTGDAELIRNSGLFDADWYRATYPEAAASGLDPIDHYLQAGAALGHRPNPLFDTGYYARQMARRLAVEKASGHGA